VGCGTGEHALLAASLGLEATGIDLAAAAIERAREKAARRGLQARFVVGSVLDLAELDEQFDTVLDIEPAMIDSTFQRAAARAWLATITRT
jgi:2-polyprenyl-3-methyl-5-hydroxy-6-metoxy-1,4-benzoquinol methylase